MRWPYDEQARCVIWRTTQRSYEQALRARAASGSVRSAYPQARREDLRRSRGAHGVLVGWRPGNYLKHMPRLRWIQAMTAGVDRGLRALISRAEVTLCCARGSHRLSMPENILGALFHLTKPYMAIALDQRESRWTKRCRCRSWARRSVYSVSAPWTRGCAQGDRARNACDRHEAYAGTGSVRR